MSNTHLLDILIPTYKRASQVIVASNSAAKQICDFGLTSKVHISIVDDGSPNFSIRILQENLAKWPIAISIKKNTVNKGMSLNILEMIKHSSAHFCTVLTDDDWMEEGSLVEIIEYLQIIKDKVNIGGIFTPRYSYIESGKLHCIVCAPFGEDKLINAGAVNSLKYCHNGFILTGFIFRTCLTAKHEWGINIENCWFPVINFSSILFHQDILFANKKWFHHTCLNKCYWERWGNNHLNQSRRLYRDYMNLITDLADKASRSSMLRASKAIIFYYQFYNYSQRILAFSNHIGPSYLRWTMNDVSPHTRKHPAFLLAWILSPRMLAASLISKWKKSLKKSVN